MKVAGFTIIKNAVKYGYPLVESLSSLLPLCDQVFVLAGDSDDGTEDLIRSISSDKIVILQSVWDKTLTQNGEILSVETNKALAAIPPEYDWCIYLQADEVIHENDYPEIKAGMLQYQQHALVQGLLFQYKHFWGSYDYICNSTRWYRKEIRIIKNDKEIFSFKDAQGFRYRPNEKLNVVELNACIYHYGWVRPPKKMQAKHAGVQQYWDNQAAPVADTDDFDYSQIDSLARYTGSHPRVMQTVIAEYNWDFKYIPGLVELSPKEKFKRILEKLTGYRFFEYKNYKIIPASELKKHQPISHPAV
ncbi:MAG: glycosyltransferase family 2 protein [Chitinophagaceae bacterium]|nr:glycosyltransferase family 2 protein [Chitinophagaceae bacterium]